MCKRYAEVLKPTAPENSSVNKVWFLFSVSRAYKSLPPAVKAEKTIKNYNV